MTDRPLLGKSVYVARPIDLIAKADGPALDSRVGAVESDLTRAGAVVYNPAGAFQVPIGVPPHPYVNTVNNWAVDRADAVVGCFPELSIGVPMEMQRAKMVGTSVVVMSDRTNVSWALADYLDLTVTWSTWTEDLAREIEGAETRRDLGDILKYTGDDRFAPVRKHGDDAGFDLYVSAETSIPAGSVIDVPCGVRLELPEGLWALVIGRSSTSRKHHLRIDPSVIDGGYRGDMFTAVHNTGERAFTAEVGMRLAQIIPLPNYAMDLTAMKVPELSPGSRGEKGFGSSGT